MYYKINLYISTKWKKAEHIALRILAAESSAYGYLLGIEQWITRVQAAGYTRVIPHCSASIDSLVLREAFEESDG